MKLWQKHFQQRQWIPGKVLVDGLLICLVLSDLFLFLKHFLGLLLIYNVVFNFHWTANDSVIILGWPKSSFGFFWKILWKTWKNFLTYPVSADSCFVQCGIICWYHYFDARIWPSNPFKVASVCSFKKYFVVKYTWHKICHCNSFQVYNSLALIIFRVLCNHLNYFQNFSSSQTELRYLLSNSLLFSFTPSTWQPTF